MELDNEKSGSAINTAALMSRNINQHQARCSRCSVQLALESIHTAEPRVWETSIPLGQHAPNVVHSKLPMLSILQMLSKQDYLAMGSLRDFRPSKLQNLINITKLQLLFYFFIFFSIPFFHGHLIPLS